MQKISLKKNEEHRIKQGHLWVFSNEVESDERRVESDECRVQNGDVVEVYDSRNNFFASGFYNANSLIAVRILTNEKEFDLSKLLEERLTAAYNFRKTIYTKRNSFRMVFSESDFLPGLIIDKYDNTFVLQVYSYGMEKNIEAIITILKEKFSAKNIFTKNEEYFRKLEGLPVEDKIYLGEVGEEIISDGFVNYKINFVSSHKTGFYFDQCDNRDFAGKLCKDKSVLDCFCNSGGFGLHAAYNGAKSVTFVDSSKHEIENAKTNFELNSFNCNAEFIDSDVFDYLEKCIAQKQKYDVVIIDPPAFAKNKKSLPVAMKGYEKLNRLALEVTANGGFLFTASCSHHLKEEIFLEVLHRAAIKAGKKVQMFYFNNASLDHPSLPVMEETVYLKFAALRIL
ncbi:MAG: class I SAM-dependent rRNA methyltransferase [Ignavibacteriales bacterium]|nr:class I SAM-dependent rRNA methyltransferase [Ignavibacteriales bacterium]